VIAVPDGYLIDNHLVFGDLKKGTVIARGMACEFPDLSSSEDEAFLSLEGDIRLIMGCMKTDERLQLVMKTDCDLEVPLARFEKKIEDRKVPALCRAVRRELVHRYRQRIKEETLIHASVNLFISARMSKWYEPGKFDSVLAVHRRSFEQHWQFVHMMLAGYGGNARLMNDMDHLEAMTRFWSPSQAKIPIIGTPNLDLTIEELCRYSDIAPKFDIEKGFYLDGQHVGIWVFKTLPPSTIPVTMQAFFALSIPNITVTVNMEPQEIDAQIQHEEQEWQKLYSNAYPKGANPPPPSLQAIEGMRKHQQNMADLLANKTLPFKCQIVVVATDKTQAGLDIKMEAIRLAIGKTGSKPYLPQLPTSAVEFFNCCTPGFGSWNAYDYWYDIKDWNLANMWPVGSTPEASLKAADWICDGDLNNLIGGRVFAGARALHTTVAGETGSGKSALLQNLIVQTSEQFGLIVVVDNGRSYQNTLAQLDPRCKPIVVRANGEHTFNIFDTRGLPLSPSHLAACTSLCHLLVGRNSDEDKDRLRDAILADVILELYRSWYEDWRKTHPIDHYQVSQMAAFLLRRNPELHIRGDLAEALHEARELSIKYEDIPAAEIAALDHDSRTVNLVRNLAFAFWDRDQFPTLTDLHSELNAQALEGKHKEQCAFMATLISGALRGKRFGNVLDGASNVDLGNCFISKNDPLKIIHFELQMEEAEKELQKIIAFIITNDVMNIITGMPRDIKKLLDIEEMGSFLELPNGDRMVVNVLQTMRKFMCQVVSVFQHLSTLLEINPKVAKAVISNSSNLILMRNKNRSDLKLLSTYITLPQVIQDKLAKFRAADDFAPGDDIHTDFVLVELLGNDPRFTVGCNYMSRDMIYLTSSSGTDFEQKKKELKDGKTIDFPRQVGGEQGPERLSGQ